MDWETRMEEMLSDNEGKIHVFMLSEMFLRIMCLSKLG